MEPERSGCGGIGGAVVDLSWLLGTLGMGMIWPRLYDFGGMRFQSGAYPTLQNPCYLLVMVELL